MYKRLLISRLITLAIFCLTFVESTDLKASEAGLAEGLDKSLEELLETKISSAAKYDQTTSEAAASVTIVTSEDIRRYGYKNLRDMLQSQRSFYSTYDRNYVYMGLRGFSRPGSYNNQIVLMLDGRSVNEKVFGSPFFGYDFALNPDVIERIEIVRGPGSALYGNSATFAVINVITKRGKEIDGAKVSASIGSFGLKKYTVAAGKEFNNGISATVSAMYGESDGEDQYYEEFDTPEQNNGVAKNLDWEKFWGAQFLVEYEGLTAQGFFSTRYKAVPTASWGTLFNNKPFDMNDTRAFFEINYEFSPLDNVQSIIRAGYDGYFCGGIYPYAGETEEDPASFQRDSSTARSATFEAQTIWDVSTKNRLTFGFETQQITRAGYDLWWDGAKEFDVSFDKPNNIYSAYIQNQHQFLPDFGVTLGLRYDKYTLVDLSNVSARAAFVYNAWEGGVVKLLYNNAFRAPNVYELYYEDLDGFIPNPELKPEIINVLEGLVEHKFNSMLWGMASVFGYSYNDLIDQTPVNDSLTQFRNISAVNAFGLEFELKAMPMNAFSGYFSFSAQSAINKETNKSLTNSPTIIANLGATHSFFDFLRLSAELFYETGRYTPQGSKTDQTFIGNFFIALATDQGDEVIHGIFERLNLTLKIENVFDAEYYHPANFEHSQSKIRQNGRTFEFQAIVKI